MHLDRDDLARIRVGSCVGPLTETVLSLGVLRSGAVEPLLVGWHRRIRPLVVRAPHLDDLLHRTWSLDLVRTAHGRTNGPLRPGVAESSPVTSQWSVQVRLVGSAAPSGVLGALESYHGLAVEPYWSAVRTTLAAARTQLQHVARKCGVSTMLGLLHPTIVWWPPELRVPSRGEQVVELHDLGGAGLVLVPSFFCRRAWMLAPRSVTLGSAPHLLLVPVTADLLARAGAVWPLGGVQPSSLAALLGKTRAAVLQSLVAGACTTTELARRCGASLSSASQHAAVLRDAGLIRTERDRNAVLHSLTALGESLLGGAPVDGAG